MWHVNSNATLNQIYSVVDAQCVQHAPSTSLVEESPCRVALLCESMKSECNQNSNNVQALEVLTNENDRPWKQLYKKSLRNVNNFSLKLAESTVLHFL